MIGHRFSSWFSFAAALLIASCGGGGGGDDGGTTTPTYSIQGRISSASNISVDSDLNDPNAAYTSNDSLISAQTLSNPTMVNGFISAVGTGVSGDRFSAAGDVDDYYQSGLTAGQFVSLRIADFDAPADIDLGLYDTGGNLVASSTGVLEYESIAVPADGTYFIRVIGFSGISKYVLNIGSTSFATGHQAQGWPASFVPGQAIVKLMPQNLADASIQPLNQMAGVKLAHTNANRATLLKLDVGASPPITVNSPQETIRPASEKLLPKQTQEKLDTLRLIKLLNQRPDIAYAEPNFIIKPLITPDDSYYDHQEHYPQIRLPQAWDVSTGSPSSGQVIVAVVDTGVFLAHEDLAGQLLAGYDFISDPSIANDGDGIDANPDDPGDNPNPGQSSWHGTHVAGTVAAASNNNQGVAGVSWGAKIMPIRALGVGGGTSYDIIQSVRYAAGLSNDSGMVPTQIADIINLSLGGGSYIQSAQDTYTEIYNAGVITIAAAGNENTSVLSYPASYDHVISVSAMDWLNERAPYSNYGTAIDVGAPGGDTSVDRNGDGYGDGVLSTVADDTSGTRTSSYAFYQGTSMAAPHMAGVVALMKAVYQGLTPSVMDAVLSAGDITNDLGDPGRDDIYGHGMIDALKAVGRAQELAGSGGINTVIANPTSIDFSTGLDSATITLSPVGTAPPVVNNFDDDAAWLSIEATSVDVSGMGTYTLTVDRTGLVDANYTATVTFDLSDGSTLTVSISIRVQTVTVTEGNAGFLYIALFDSGFNNQAQLAMSATNGVYDYQFTNVPAGEYYLIAGSDIDNDFLICSTGESCGAYPLTSSISLINLNSNLTGIDFDATINSGLSGITSLATANDIPAKVINTNGSLVRQ